MVALGSLGKWRHGVVALVVLGCSGLALAGLIGEPSHDEKFDSKQVVVSPSGDDGVRIREVVDQDFGTKDRHGYERIIPNDFGVPTDVEASSPDANADVSVDQVAEGTQIRLGDPDQTLSGQHRYVLTYTLPEARLGTGELALDIIGSNEPLATDSFEVVVTGLQLEEPLCSVGAFATSGGCTLEGDGDVYRAVIDDLEPGEGITIGGRIVGRTDTVDVAVPELPARRQDNRAKLAAAMLPLGALVAGGTYAWARRRGRNEVFAGGAADAAYGTAPAGALPPPGAPRLDVRLVADEDLGDLATIEFVPPKGLEPWQGTVLLRERIDNESVTAWFSGQAAHDVITIERNGEDATVGIGPNYQSAAAGDASVLSTLFAGGDHIELGKYDKDFAAAWRSVRAEQERSIAQSGFWKRWAPSGGGCTAALSFPAIAIVGAWLFIGAGSMGTALLGWFSGPVGGLVFGVVIPALAAYAMYRSLLPARSAAGSALALRTESFRRFLAASEGRHVEWAWKQGLLREYSAWAVALGAASAWERAMEASSVPPAELSTGPILLYNMSGSFAHTYTPPSSSGSGSSGGFGGGFSGGSVGGGGGGGSSGSW